MTALKIAGIVVLALLLVVLLLGMLLLTLRTRLEVRGKNGELRIRIGVGPLRIPIYPLPARAKRPDKPAKPPKPRRKPKKPKEPPVFHWERVGWSDTLELIMDVLSAIGDRLYLETLLLNLVLASKDAARTGMLYGGATAAAGMLVPFLEEHFNVEDLQMRLRADFDSHETQWAAVLVCAARPVSVLRALWRERRRLWAFYHTITEKDEAKKS